MEKTNGNWNKKIKMGEEEKKIEFRMRERNS